MKNYSNKIKTLASFFVKKISNFCIVNTNLLSINNNLNKKEWAFKK